MAAGLALPCAAAVSIREAQLYQRLAGHVLFPPASLRATGEVMCSNRQGQPGLWRHGISGDLPIVLLRLPEGREAMELCARVVNAHTYNHTVRAWFSRGQIARMYERNPHWASIERQVYGYTLAELPI